MSGTDDHSLLRGSGRILMLSTVLMASAVLILGTADARLLRLGLLAALWAALLAAFATVRARREISSCAAHADQLRTLYQRELEREVAARREHTQRIEGEFREQAALWQRREIGELRTELAGMRANLEQLLGGNPRREHAPAQPKSPHLLPRPTHPRKFDDRPNQRPAGPHFGPDPLPTPTWTSGGRHSEQNRDSRSPRHRHSAPNGG